jgi:integrative and conjugative element protein (TIGR02256 family)
MRIAFRAIRLVDVLQLIVETCAAVQNATNKYIQIAPHAPESSDLLLGSLPGNNLLVVEATGPTIFDNRLRYLFERMPFGHKTLSERRWRQSGGTVRYLAEWHTHPQDYRAPLQLDRDEWLALAKRRVDERPMLAVVVGRKMLHIELVSRLGDGTIFSPFQ